MKIWMRLMGICFLAMFVVGCAVKERGPSPKSTYSSPEAQKQVVSKSRAKVTAHRLNLREKGSAKSRVLGVLKKGEILQTLSKKGKWVQVHNDTGLSGWVFSRYIEPIDGISIAKAKGVKEVSPALENDESVKSILYTQLRDWQGVRYQFGGLSRSGIDCSGFDCYLQGTICRLKFKS